jgi:hypothetical protein
MSRKTEPLHLIREYHPDPERCVKALIALLLWEPPADTPATDQDAACGEAQQAEPAESDQTH